MKMCCGAFYCTHILYLGCHLLEPTPEERYVEDLDHVWLPLCLNEKEGRKKQN